MCKSGCDQNENMDVGPKDYDGDLQQKYRDETIDMMTREHMFYGYWRTYLADHKVLTRQDLEYILEFRQWWGPIGELIKTASVTNMLSMPDVVWLMEELPVESYAWQQLAALQLLKQDVDDLDAKLTRLLDLRADWATVRFIQMTPEDRMTNWIKIVETSKRPKRAKQELLKQIRSKLITNHIL